MIKQFVSPEEVINFLNELLGLDKKCISSVSLRRQICNNSITEHPTVQVHSFDGKSEVGMIGILNGLFGSFDSGEHKGWGTIAAEVNEDTGLIDKFFLIKE